MRQLPIAPNANHAFDSEELLNFTEEDHRFLDAEAPRLQIQRILRIAQQSI